MNGGQTAVRILCIMHYALLFSASLYGDRSPPSPMHFEIYAIRYNAFKTFRLYFLWDHTAQIVLAQIAGLGN
jgi:hypothetical protein